MLKKILAILKLKYADYLNERAFTLVEMLFTFSIFLLIIFFISPILQVIENVHLQDRINDIEWEVFCSQIKKEIRMSTKIQMTGNTLVLTEDNGSVEYEKYETSLRRRVNSLGHEILLQNISSVDFSLQKMAVKIEITDLSGRSFTITVYSFLDRNDV